MHIHVKCKWMITISLTPRQRNTTICWGLSPSTTRTSHSFDHTNFKVYEEVESVKCPKKIYFQIRLLTQAHTEIRELVSRPSSRTDGAQHAASAALARRETLALGTWRPLVANQLLPTRRLSGSPPFWRTGNCCFLRAPPLHAALILTLVDQYRSFRWSISCTGRESTQGVINTDSYRRVLIVATVLFVLRFW